jgi:hypothetical protein
MLIRVGLSDHYW